MTPGRKYDRFRDRVIFPIVNQRGKVIAMGGRVLGDGKPKYLNSPETPLFSKSHELYGLHHIRKFAKNLSRIVVVEGYMDVIALAQFGIHYAVATLGTSVGKPHLEMLFQRVDQVVFCFDGDGAGRKAAFRGMEAALPMMEDGRQVKFLFLPEGEDPDSVVHNKGSQHLEHLFDNADPLETFLFDQMAQGIDLDTMDGKARLSKLVAPYINLIPDGVFKTLLFKSLATRTDMDVELAAIEEIEKPVTADYDSAPGPEPGEIQSEAALIILRDMSRLTTAKITMGPRCIWSLIVLSSCRRWACWSSSHLLQAR